MKKLFLVALLGLSSFFLEAMDYGPKPQCTVCLKELERLAKVLPDCGHTQCIHCFVFHKYGERSESCQICNKPSGVGLFKSSGNEFINVFDRGRDQSVALELCEKIKSRSFFRYNIIVEELELLMEYSADEKLIIRSDAISLLEYYLNFKNEQFKNRTPVELAEEAKRNRDSSFFIRLECLAKYVKKAKKNK